MFVSFLGQGPVSATLTTVLRTSSLGGLDEGPACSRVASRARALFVVFSSQLDSLVELSTRQSQSRRKSTVYLHRVVYTQPCTRSIQGRSKKGKTKSKSKTLAEFYSLYSPSVDFIRIADSDIVRESQ